MRTQVRHCVSDRNHTSAFEKKDRFGVSERYYFPSLARGSYLVPPIRADSYLPKPKIRPCSEIGISEHGRHGIGIPRQLPFFLPFGAGGYNLGSRTKIFSAFGLKFFSLPE